MGDKNKNTTPTRETTNQDASNQAATNPEITNPRSTDERTANAEATNPETTNQDASNQAATNPETTNPRSTDERTTNAEATNPETTNQDASNQAVTNPETTNPRSTDERTTNAEATNPETTNQDASNQAATNPETTNPRSTDERTTNAEATNPETTNQDASNQAATNPETTNPRSTDERTTNAEATNPETTNQDASNQAATNPETTNPRSTDERTTNAEATNPETTNQDASNQAVTNPETTNPRSTDERNINAEATNPETTNQDASNQAATNPETTNPRSTDERTTNAEATNPETTNQDASNQAVTNPETTNSRSTDERTTNAEATNPETTNQDASNQARNITETTNQDTSNQAATNAEATNQDASNQVTTTPETTDQTGTNAEATTQVATNIDATNQDTSDQVANNIETISQDTAKFDPASPDSTQVPFHKAARFHPTIAEQPSSTQPHRQGPWRSAMSLQRLSDARELDVDMFETVLFHVGEFGRYQQLLLVAIIPFAVYFSWVYFTPMFLLLTPKPYWCIVPELSFLSKESRRDLSGAGQKEWDGCKVYKIDWNEVIKTMMPPPSGTPLVPCRNGWEYDYSEIPYETVVSERDWVCNRAKYSITSQSAFFAGSLAGGILFGWMADHFGRVPALMVNLVGGVAGMITILTTGEWDFILCRFIYGMAFDNCFMIAYILVLEYVGPKHRTLVANLPLVLYDGTGAVALPWVAYFIASWRWFSFVTSLVLFIGLLSPWLLPESARWLISRGRTNDAVKVLKRFEAINKTKIPENILDKFIVTSRKNENMKQASIKSMFDSVLLRHTLIFMAIAYCFLAVAYDALVRMSESFGLDFFVTFTINAFSEIPSVIVAAMLLDRLGRRNLTFGPTVLGAICIIIAMFVPKGVPRVCVAVVARFLINLSFTVSVQWVAEILPTPFRATGSAAMHMCGFASSLMSPLIVYSGRYWSSLPLVILVVMSLTAAAFSLLVPETKGEEMPQTVADAEDIIKENSLYGPRDVNNIKKAFNTIQSSTFIEPVVRSPEGRVTLRLSRMQLR